MSRRLHQEDGIALPVAVIVLGLALLLTAALALSTTRSSAQANTDRLVKRALQAADAGLEVARNQLARVKAVATPALGPTDCLTADPATGAVYKGGTAVGGWCPAVTGTLGDGTTYSYQVSTATPRTIISTGTAGVVGGTGAQSESRKVVSTQPVTTTVSPYFGLYGISAYDDLDFSGGVNLLDDAYGKVNVRTNGNITLAGGAQLGCGLYTPGPAKTTSIDGGASWCTGDRKVTKNYNGAQYKPPEWNPAATALVYPEIEGVDAAATTNDDARITNCWYPDRGTSGPTATQDSCPIVDQYNRASFFSSKWNATNRTLLLDGNYQLTLRGGVYHFCRFQITGGATLTVPGDRPVKIFIDKCNGQDGTFTRDNGGKIVNESGKPENLQFYVRGGGAAGILNNGDQNAFTLYAPTSTVTVSGAGLLKGAVAGKTVTVAQGAKIISNDEVAKLGATTTTNGGTPIYKECVTPRTSAVDSGCG